MTVRADLNNRLLQTTSSKELLAIMREIREKQAANSEAPNKSRRHLSSVPKPCGIGYQTRPTAEETVPGSDQRIARSHQRKRGLLRDTWQRSAPVPSFPTCTPAVSVWRGFLWRLVEKPSEHVSTQSQHLRTQQRSEMRGCHSHPTHGEMETDTGERTGTNWHDDDMV